MSVIDTRIIQIMNRSYLKYKMCLHVHMYGPRDQEIRRSTAQNDGLCCSFLKLILRQTTPLSLLRRARGIRFNPISVYNFSSVHEVTRATLMSLNRTSFVLHLNLGLLHDLGQIPRASIRGVSRRFEVRHINLSSRLRERSATVHVTPALSLFSCIQL
jgi:hypothetical protein